MTPTPDAARLAALAEDDAVRHLRALLRIDTTNPPGNERRAVDYLVPELRAEGIEPTVVEPAPGRANLVARLRGDGSLPPLLLHSHLDTVAAEASRWRYPPLSGEIAEGFIWGRGAVDMKGMTAFQLAALAWLKRSGIPLRRDVILCAFADEEDGMACGSRWLVDHGPDLVRAEYAIGEVGGFSAQVGRTRIYPVGVAEKGVCWLRLRARGDTGHGSIGGPENAVAKLAEAVARLARARIPGHLTPTTRHFIEAVAAAAGRPSGLLLQALLHGPSREAALRALARARPEQGRLFRAMLHNTLTPTVLAAGEKENVVPGTAEAVVDGRVLPGTSRPEFVQAVRRVVGRGVEVEVVSWVDPHEFAADSPVLDAVRAATARHDPGARAVPWLNPGCTDAAELARLGTQCYGYYPLRLPPGLEFSRLFHGDDERVPVDGYRFGLRLFLDVVAALAG